MNFLALDAAAGARHSRQARGADLLAAVLTGAVGRSGRLHPGAHRLQRSRAFGLSELCRQLVLLLCPHNPCSMHAPPRHAPIHGRPSGATIRYTARHRAGCIYLLAARVDPRRPSSRPARHTPPQAAPMVRAAARPGGQHNRPGPPPAPERKRRASWQRLNRMRKHRRDRAVVGLGGCTDGLAQRRIAVLVDLAQAPGQLVGRRFCRLALLDLGDQ